MIAGFAAVLDDPLLAAVAATATLTVCGGRRRRVVGRPGRVRSRSPCSTGSPLLTPAELAARVRLS